MRRLRLVVVTAFVIALLGVSSAAFAQSGGNVEPPGIGGEQLGRGEAPAPAAERSSEGVLPFTGADLTLFVVIGLGAIGAGTVMMRRTRKARSV